MTTHSIDSSSSINTLTQKKIESLLNAFSEMDYDSNQEINKEELTNFLNSHSRNMNQVLINKLFNLLDLNDNNSISIEEFIKGYIQLESDLKKTNNDLNNKYKMEKKNFDDFNNQKKKYQTEKLNSEGFCENASVTVIIEDVNIQSKLDHINSIGIKIIYNDEVKETKFKSGNLNFQLNEKFVFKPKSRKDHFEFVLKEHTDNDQTIDLGNKIFPLDSIDSQDEYDVKIIIPDLNDNSKELAHINCKIIFYWSDFEFYEEKTLKSQKTLNKLQNAIKKTNEYLQILNELYGNVNIVNGLSNQQQDLVNNNANNFNNFDENNNNNFNYDNNHIKNINLNNKYVDSTKNSSNLKIKKSNNTDFNDRSYNIMNDNANSNSTNILNPNNKKISDLKLMKLTSLGVFCLSLLNNFYKNDFLNTLGGLGIYLSSIFIFLDKNKVKTYLKYLLYLIIGLIIFDLIWFILYLGKDIDYYTEGNENGIKSFSLFITFLNILIKGGLLYSVINLNKNLAQNENRNKNLIQNQNY
jgi:hypothetical protein